MSARGWGGSVATAVGVAAGTGAAQLGVGYGLGILAWPADAAGAGVGAWVSSLAWTTWIAASSAVAGALWADRLGPVPRSTLDSRRGAGAAVTTSMWHAVLALASSTGALVTVPLVAVPARAVVHPETSAPQTIAGGYAVIGVVLGLVVAASALVSRAIAANVVVTTGWLWLLAVVAAVDGVATGRGLATTQLAVWQFATTGPVIRNVHLWQALLTLGAALAIGALAALPAARRGDSAVGVAISGAVGPLLVAAAYFLAAPQLAGIPPRELSPYLVVPYGVIAGLAGSVTVAGLGPRLVRRPRTAAEPEPPTGPDLPVEPAAGEGAVARGTAAIPTQDRGRGKDPVPAATAADEEKAVKGRRDR